MVIVAYPRSGDTWQAIIPEPDGETIVVRYTPRALGKLRDEYRVPPPS